MKFYIRFTTEDGFGEANIKYGIIRYPDTAISYVKNDGKGWEHIYDKSYGFKGKVDSSDLKHMSPIDKSKIPGRLTKESGAAQKENKMTEEPLKYYVGCGREKLSYYASINVDIDQPDHSDLTKLLKKNKVKMKMLNKNSAWDYPMVNLTGKRKDLHEVLNDPLIDYGKSTSQWIAWN